MKKLEQHKWLWQYVLPIAILVLAVTLTLLTGALLFGARDLDIFAALVIMPITAAIVGIIFRPERVLVVAAAAVVLWEIPIFLSRGMDGVVVTIIPVILLVGLPIALLLWAGKAARPWIDNKLASRYNLNQPPAG